MSIWVFGDDLSEWCDCTKGRSRTHITGNEISISSELCVPLLDEQAVILQVMCNDRFCLRRFLLTN